MEGQKKIIEDTHSTASIFLDSGKEIMAKQVLELIEEAGLSAEQKVERIRMLVKCFIPDKRG